MSRRVLVVDATATNRIALKAALAAARYDVTAVSTATAALNAIGKDAPDLILCDAALPDMSAAELCDKIRDGSAAETAPVIVLMDAPSPEDRLAALRAGAETLLMRPLERSWLLTNIRALLRAHQTRTELKRRNGTAARLGFSEAQPAFEHPARVGIVARERSEGARIARLLGTKMNHQLMHLDPATAIVAADDHGAPEAFILASDLDIDETLWLLSELRARPETRRAAIVAEYSADSHELGARALDLGASDLVQAEAAAEEVSLRIDRQIRIKRNSDRLRANIDAGLAMAVRDPLTGLFNRRYAHHHLAELAENHYVEGRGFGVLMMDIDHFKQVNDTYGHAAGDLVLTRIARVLSEKVREFDLVARMGGEEFLIALPDTSPDETFAAAERLRQAIAKTETQVCDNVVKLTCSVGTACSSRAVPNPVDVIALADAALYAAKDSGRNRTVASHLAERAPEMNRHPAA